MVDHGASEETVNAEHDDIIRRLLEYQRDLREEIPPSGASRRITPSPGLIDYEALERQNSVAVADGVVDLRGAEASLSAEAREAAALRARVEELESLLAGVVHQLTDARRRAYDAVLALDDRLGDIERVIDSTLKPDA